MKKLPLEPIKKNLVSIICGVIVLAAVIALFWPISGKYQKLQQDADARKTDFNIMKGLLNKDRHFPQLSLEDTEQKKLDKFPTEPVIALGNKLVDQFKSESATLVDAALKMNQHQLLVPDVLPAGGSDLGFTFRDQYKNMLDLTKLDNRKTSKLVQILKGGFLPTQNEIDAEVAKQEQLIRSGPAFNTTAIDAEVRIKKRQLPEEIRENVARNSQIYIDPTAFDMYPPLVSNVTTSPDLWQIFGAQMSLWVQEDLAKSIAAANKDSKSVMNSAVKRLIKVKLPPNMFAGIAAAQASLVAPANTDPGQILTKNFASAPTGRTTNGIYDVIRFTVQMDVDAEKIPLIFQELSRGKFVTILQFSMTSLDGPLQQTNGYYFGDKPLVEVNMQCEELMLRKWTVPLMPDNTLRALGLPITPPTPSK